MAHPERGRGNGRLFASSGGTGATVPGFLLKLAAAAVLLLIGTTLPTQNAQYTGAPCLFADDCPAPLICSGRDSRSQCKSSRD